LASRGRALQAELLEDQRIANGWLTVKDAPGIRAGLVESRARGVRRANSV